MYSVTKKHESEHHCFTKNNDCVLLKQWGESRYYIVLQILYFSVIVCEKYSQQNRFLFINKYHVQENAGNIEATNFLASLKEFVKICGPGCDGSFKLTCQDGCAKLKLEFKQVPGIDFLLG